MWRSLDMLSKCTKKKIGYYVEFFLFEVPFMEGNNITQSNKLKYIDIFLRLPVMDILMHWFAKPVVWKRKINSDWCSTSKL